MPVHNYWQWVCVLLPSNFSPLPVWDVVATWLALVIKFSCVILIVQPSTYAVISICVTIPIMTITIPIHLSYNSLFYSIASVCSLLPYPLPLSIIIIYLLLIYIHAIMIKYNITSLFIMRPSILYQNIKTWFINHFNHTCIMCRF